MAIKFSTFALSQTVLLMYQGRFAAYFSSERYTYPS